MALESGLPPLVDGQLFRFITELETRKAVRFRYPVSLVTIAIGNADQRKVEESIRQVIRCVDLITHHPGVLNILLIDASPEDAHAIIRRIRGIVVGGADFDFRLTCFPATASTFADLLAQAEGAP